MQIAASYFGDRLVDPTDPDDPTYAQFINALNLENIEFPLGPVQIKQLLKQNKELDITLQVFEYYKKVHTTK